MMGTTKPNVCRMAARCVAILAVAVVAAACSRATAPPVPQGGQQQQVASTSPVVRFVAEAGEGARARIQDPLVGGLVDVDVGPRYVSANANLCKRFNTTAVGGTSTVRTWAICRDRSAVWALVTAGAAPLAE